MGKVLVIVESPAKAKTISKFLGSGFVVESSIGHVRDLPSSATEIPAAFKKKPWARTGVDVENDFTPLYVVPPKKKAQVAKLKGLLAGVDALYLATDEDREGEAIAWHLCEVLAPKVPVKRMVFHEITEKAIKQALDNPRQIDQQLVAAQEARRILDRLYGYEVSPVLWRKVAPRLSAGRVQSVATRLIVERERARVAFRSGTWWSVSVELDQQPATDRAFGAELLEFDGRRAARSDDFDPATGALKPGADVALLGEPRARALEAALRDGEVTVVEVQKRPHTQRPAAPFTTSTLQQEAGRKLRYSAQRTMRIAQRLYENGYITYMRTDSTTLSTQALDAARSQIIAMYGEQFLPEAPRTYQTKSKGAQEAHEAIRPAGEAFRTPEDLKTELDEESFRLYDLVWKRTVASQMKDALGERTSVRMEAKTREGVARLSSSGKVVLFPGFLRAYVEGSDDPEAELEDRERILPALALGEKLTVRNAAAESHQTQPPARFTEASLVKELEERGIGRPSTYASIIQTIQDRGYSFKKGTALVPTFTAFAVVNLLERHFPDLVDYAFTATMESDLDAISEGEKQATPWLKRFYFGRAGPQGKTKARGSLEEIGLQARVEGSADDIDPRAVCEVRLGETAAGELVAARVGRYGPYLQVGDTDRRVNLAEDLAPDELTLAKALEILEAAADANKPLGTDPQSGKPIYVKSGRFGPYLQVGDVETNEKGKLVGEKPKMASLWPGMEPRTVTLAQALEVLSFPKSVGVHPVTGLDIMLSDGKFGPYILMEGEGREGAKVREARSLPDRAMMLTLTLDQAVALLAQPRQGRGRAASQEPLASLGTSPTTKEPIVVKTGRFGAYVTDGQVNATIPTSKDPLKLSLDDALELIAAREARLRDQGIDPRAPDAAKKAKAARRAPAKAKGTKKAAKKKKAPATQDAPEKQDAPE